MPSQTIGKSGRKELRAQLGPTLGRSWPGLPSELSRGPARRGLLQKAVYPASLVLLAVGKRPLASNWPLKKAPGAQGKSCPSTMKDLPKRTERIWTCVPCTWQGGQKPGASSTCPLVQNSCPRPLPSLIHFGEAREPLSCGLHHPQ